MHNPGLQIKLTDCQSCDLFTGFKKKISTLDSTSVVRDIFVELSEDPVLGILPGTPGWKTQELAKLLLNKEWNCEPLYGCSKSVFSSITKAMEKASDSNFSCAGTLEMLACMTGSSKSLQHQEVSKELLGKSLGLAVAFRLESAPTESEVKYVVCNKPKGGRRGECRKHQLVVL